MWLKKKVPYIQDFKMYTETEVPDKTTGEERHPQQQCRERREAMLMSQGRSPLDQGALSNPGSSQERVA